MIVGIRITPMRKLLLVENSMQVRPRVVEVIRIKMPRNPETRKVIVIRKIRVIIEIFV